MFDNFEVIIGIENHVELKTKSKMFGSGPVEYGVKQNTRVSAFDLGYPGVLPSVNKEGVKLAILACNALNMKIDPLLKFDRKNYYYPDLPKGFQITQQFFPIGREGSLEIILPSGEKKVINIERLHIEEDTAKQIHKGSTTFLDYNRSSTGLIEIVTKPVLRSADEAVAYVEKLREILLFLEVSDVKMNEGSLRCDVNISLRPKGSKDFGSKVEIKNLNSLSNVRKAIYFEIDRQRKLYLKGEEVILETRRFDEASQQTVSMRKKETNVDYKYFTEPNIMPIQLDQKWIDEIIKNSPQSADEKRIIYTNNHGLSLEEANYILQNIHTTKFYEATILKAKNKTRVANLIISNIQSFLNQNNLQEINQTKLTSENLADLVNLVEDKIISSKHLKTILPIILEKDTETTLQIVERLNLKIISDEKIISEMILKIINENEDLINQYNDRPERVLKTIIGSLMKDTQGNVDPDIANALTVKLVEQNLK